MQRTFTYTLLITCILLVGSCKTQYVTSSVEYVNISVSDSLYSLDNNIVELYQPYKNTLEKDMERVISFSENEMEKDKPESPLTNFLADLLLEEGLKEAQKNGRSCAPSVSYFNYGGIRTFLPKGKITVGKIFELMPFENEMVYVQLNGTQIQEFLDKIAAKGGDSLGGVRFTISDEKAVNIVIGSEPLKQNETYWLVTNDYIAAGGDEMEVLTRNTGLVNSGKKIRDVIILHLEEKQKKGEVLNVKTDGRITHG